MLPTTVEAIRAQAEMSLFDLPPLPEVIYQRMMAELAKDMQAETDMLNSVPRDEAHIRSKLGQIFNTLTIIIWGAKSPFFAAAEGEALHAALPGSATVVFKTSGAFPQLEHPDDFAESLIFVMMNTKAAANRRSRATHSRRWRIHCLNNETCREPRPLR